MCIVDHVDSLSDLRKTIEKSMGVLLDSVRSRNLQYAANEHRGTRESVRFHIPRVDCVRVCNPFYSQHSTFPAEGLATVQMEYLSRTFENSSDLDFVGKPS